MEKFNLLSEVLLNKEAQASLENPTLTKLSFVFTDNKPNGNNKGIPTSAFPSIIKTGIFMPVKMAEGEIAIDHAGAVPLGVIASLENKQLSEDTEQVIGNAVLWGDERPEDTSFIKSTFASGKPLNISWELLYSDSKIDENGVEWLLNPIVKAATFVGLPAYSGRTPVLEVASQKLPLENYLYIEPSEDSDGIGKFLYKDIDGNIDRNLLEKASVDIVESELPEDTKQELILKVNSFLETQGNSAMEIDELKARVAELEAKLAEYETKFVEKETELSSLKEFKSAIEQKEAEAALLKSRLEIFSSLGVEFTPEEIEAKKANWLKMDDEQFTFYSSELKGRKIEKSSLQPTLVPDRITNPDLTDPIEIVRAGLRELGKK